MKDQEWAFNIATSWNRSEYFRRCLDDPQMAVPALRGLILNAVWLDRKRQKYKLKKKIRK